MKRDPWRRRQLWTLPIMVLCWAGSVVCPLLTLAACCYQWGGTAVWMSAAGFLVSYVGFCVSLHCGATCFDGMADDVRDGLDDGSVATNREADS